MNCKICGAELKREGEVCNNCMNKLMEEQRLRNDVNQTYTFKQKFVLGYEILRHIEQIGIVIFMIILILSVEHFSYWRLAVLSGCVFSIIGILYLLYANLTINSGVCSLYNSRLVYTKGWLKKKKKEIPFSEIEEISYKQGTIERYFNIGKIVIDKKSRIIFEKLIVIDSVKNVDQVFENIKNVFENNEVGR